MLIHLSSLGCRLNEAELEQWAEAFAAAGDRIAASPEEADVLVLNTCAVTREAVRKSRQRLQRLQRANPSAKLVISGCYSELAPRHALAELGIDLIVPNAHKNDLVRQTHRTFADVSMPESATQPANTALFVRNRHRAFIKIQDGCRYRCSYCIVTVARGAERSRTIDDIVNEVQRLQCDSVHEIVLTGVHVGGYGSDLGSNLEQLVRALLDRTDMPRIRFASVEPWDLSDEFLTLFENPRVMPHMHLPLQSGSDSVLRRMARRCRTTDFARLSSALRTVVPHFNVTTDIIAGFPGETEQEWNDSLAFIKTQGFGHIHAFTYSEREGTRAARLPGKIPKALKQQRSRELHSLGEALKRHQLQRSIGTTVAVLWERGRKFYDEHGRPRWTHQGYTPNYQRVCVVAPVNLANHILPTRIDDMADGQLIGRLLDTPDALADTARAHECSTWHGEEISPAALEEQKAYSRIDGKPASPPADTFVLQRMNIKH